MPKKFTNNMQPPVGIGAKIGLQSPILASYAATQDTTKGVVVEYVTNDDDQLDNCTVLFRGKLIKATCCHPGIEVNMAVSIIEQPIGCFWATVLQRSWYSRQLSELTDKGHPFQAAAEYLLKDQPKWQPQIILIDKRGVEPEPPTPPPPPPVEYEPIDTLGYDVTVGYTISQWPYSQDLFAIADADGDGFVNETELQNFLNTYGRPEYIDIWGGKPFNYSPGMNLLLVEFIFKFGVPYLRFVIPRIIPNMFSRVIASPPYIQYRDGATGFTCSYEKSTGAGVGCLNVSGGTDPVVWFVEQKVSDFLVRIYGRYVLYEWPFAGTGTSYTVVFS